MAFDRDLAVAAIGVDLPLHGVHVGDGGEVEILAPDERREIAEQRLARSNIAGARARLDQRRALPVLAAALVIVERRRRRYRDLGGRRIGPQPQVDAKYVAVGGALLQDFHQAAREADIKLAGLGSRSERRSRRIEKNDEIDVARIIELEGAHLAHGEHDVARSLFGMRGIARRKLLAPCRVGEKITDRRANGRVRNIGQRARHAHDRPDSANVGQRDQQRRLGLHLAQDAHDFGFVLRRRDRRARFAQERMRELHRDPRRRGARNARDRRTRDPTRKARIRRWRPAARRANDDAQAAA